MRPPETWFVFIKLNGAIFCFMYSNPADTYV